MVPDLPGFGRSDVDHQADQSIEAHAARIAWEKPARWRQRLRQIAALNTADMVECTRRLVSLEMPVTIVASDDDPAVPLVALEQVRQALPKATLDIIRDTRHFSPEESPERIADMVARLLRA